MRGTHIWPLVLERAGTGLSLLNLTAAIRLLRVILKLVRPIVFRRQFSVRFPRVQPPCSAGVIAVISLNAFSRSSASIGTQRRRAQAQHTAGVDQLVMLFR